MLIIKIFDTTRERFMNEEERKETQGLGVSGKKTQKKLYNTTRGRTHLLPFF